MGIMKDGNVIIQFKEKDKIMIPTFEKSRHIFDTKCRKFKILMHQQLGAFLPLFQNHFKMEPFQTSQGPTHFHHYCLLLSFPPK